MGEPIQTCGTILLDGGICQQEHSHRLPHDQPVFKAIGNLDPDICKVCGETIKVQIFRGTGSCSVQHDKVMKGVQPDGRILTSVGLIKRFIGEEVQVCGEVSQPSGKLLSAEDTEGTAVRTLVLEPKDNGLIEGAWTIDTKVLIGRKSGALTP